MNGILDTYIPNEWAAANGVDAASYAGYLPLQTLNKVFMYNNTGSKTYDNCWDFVAEGEHGLYMDIDSEIVGKNFLYMLTRDDYAAWLKESFDALSADEQAYFQPTINEMKSDADDLGLGADGAYALAWIKLWVESYNEQTDDGPICFDDNRLDGWETLATPAESVMIFDPLTGKKGKARTRKGPNGTTEILLQVEPGQSLLLKTFPTDVQAEEWEYFDRGTPVGIDKGWSITFLESQPPIEGTFETDSVTAWTNLDVDAAKVNTGTARYKVSFELPSGINADSWLLDLGDLRESASVKVNGQDAGKVWSVPFTIEIGDLLQPGLNTLEIDVTNLPANRIADYDRQGRKWKIFKDANIASVVGKKVVDYSDWETVPSGLNSEVKLIPLVKKQ